MFCVYLLKRKSFVSNLSVYFDISYKDILLLKTDLFRMFYNCTYPAFFFYISNKKYNQNHTHTLYYGKINQKKNP